MIYADKLQIKLLGHFQVTDKTIPLTPHLRPRAQRLLAYLLLHRHEVRLRDSIAFILWPDCAEKEAQGTLRRALSELRTALPTLTDREWIRSAHGLLGWNPQGPYWLDLEAFEGSISQATPTTLYQAIALYTGDLLAEWDEEWVLVERERLRQLQFKALRQLVAHHQTLAEYETALILARQALALDPLAEVVYRDLIALHYQAGDRAAALAEYARLRTTLRDELGVEPMAETQALLAAISQGTPLPVPSGAASGGLTQISPTRPALPQPIGRETELSKLNALWHNAARGQGRIVIISGEAGVGKTLAALSLADAAAQAGGLPLVGHCYEFEGTLPYQALVEILRSVGNVLRHANLPPVHRIMLARLVPDVVGVTNPLPGETAISSDELRLQLFEAILQAFLILAQRQPLLLLFEDAHWAVESTLDWLTYIAPRLGSSRLLVVITYRTGEVGAHHTLARLERRFAAEGTVSVLPLKPLSREANRDLVAQLSGLAEGQVASLADRLYAGTAGNPFFLRELVRGLIEGGQIKLDQGQWRGKIVEAETDVAALMPKSLRATITARVKRLTEMARLFIRLAAVAGRVFGYEVVRQAGDWSEELALSALEDLLARGFVRGAQDETKSSFAFAHHLVQEAIYADLTPPRRAYLHRRLAEAVQTLHPHDFESLAYHYAQAGEQEQARSYYVQAGDRAREVVAMTDAAMHYRAALAHWPEADRLGRAETLYKLGNCQWVIFDTQGALDSFRAARLIHEALGDWARSGEMERQIGRMYWELGDRQATLLHFQQALAILQQGPETVELARAFSSMSQTHMLASAYDEAITWGERALALAERFGAEDVKVHALNNVGVALINFKGREVERGLAMLRESLHRAQALGMPHDACRAYLNMGEELLGLCRYNEARTTFEQQYTFAMRVYARAFVGEAIRRLTELDWWSGQWSVISQRQQQMNEQTWGIWQVLTSRVLGQIYNDLGQPEVARQELENTLAQAIKWDEIQTTVPHLGQLARAYAALKLKSKTAETLHQLLEQLDHNPYLHWESTMSLLFACRWYAAQPKFLEAAHACLARLERAQGQMPSQQTAAALAEGRGLVALAEGQLLPAVEQFRYAVAQWTTIERPYDQAQVLGSLGQALIAEGDITSACLALEQALAIFEALAAQLDNQAFQQSFLNSPPVLQVREAHAKIARAAHNL